MYMGLIVLSSMKFMQLNLKYLMMMAMGMAFLFTVWKGVSCVG
jgi:hypothetical protein